MKPSKDFRTCLRSFTYYFHNGTLPVIAGESALLDLPYYREELMFEASSMEMLYTIFVNNLDMDANGKVLNQSQALKRATQFIRSVCDVDYKPNPEFADWEMTV